MLWVGATVLTSCLVSEDNEATVLAKGDLRKWLSWMEQQFVWCYNSEGAEDKAKEVAGKEGTLSWRAAASKAAPSESLGLEGKCYPSLARMYCINGENGCFLMDKTLYVRCYSSRRS